MSPCTPSKAECSLHISGIRSEFGVLDESSTFLSANRPVAFYATLRGGYPSNPGDSINTSGPEIRPMDGRMLFRARNNTGLHECMSKACVTHNAIRNPHDDLSKQTGKLVGNVAEVDHFPLDQQSSYPFPNLSNEREIDVWQSIQIFEDMSDAPTITKNAVKDLNRTAVNKPCSYIFNSPIPSGQHAQPTDSFGRHAAHGDSGAYPNTSTFAGARCAEFLDLEGDGVDPKSIRMDSPPPIRPRLSLRMRCAVENCRTIPSYSSPSPPVNATDPADPGTASTAASPQCRDRDGGAERPWYCRQHKQPHHVNLRQPRCQHEVRCERQASHGSASDRVKRRCALHRRSGDANLSRLNVCQVGGECGRRAVFGPRRGCPPVRCRLHRTEGDVDMVHKLCEHEGGGGGGGDGGGGGCGGACLRQASFGEPGGRTRFCTLHKLPHHVDTRTSRYRCVLTPKRTYAREYTVRRHARAYRYTHTHCGQSRALCVRVYLSVHMTPTSAQHTAGRAVGSVGVCVFVRACV
jgi:hypothetical protein